MGATLCACLRIRSPALLRRYPPPPPPPPWNLNLPASEHPPPTHLSLPSPASGVSLSCLHSQPFATDAVKTAGQAKSPAGVFGVTIEALSGAFLKTRVVTVWPRFVVRNNLGRKIGVLSTVEPPPKRGKDHGQSIAKATKVGWVDEGRVRRAFAVGIKVCVVDCKRRASTPATRRFFVVTGRDRFFGVVRKQVPCTYKGATGVSTQHRTVRLSFFFFLARQ